MLAVSVCMTPQSIVHSRSDIARRTTVPRRFAGAIERPFLVDRIRHGLAGQVVVLQAPPGFGKTELIAAAFALTRQEGDRFAWLTVSPADSDPAVFLQDVASAFEIAWVGSADIEADVARLLGTLNGAVRHILWLDEIELAAGEPFSQLATSFFRQLPDNVRVVIASSCRSDIPLSRFRLRGLLTELEATDLVFSRTEMRRLVGRRLSEAEFETFTETTRGWPALVQLAVPLIAEPLDPAARTEIVEGTHRVFRDFVFEEVLPRMAPDFREAFLVCSILDDFPLDLASHLAGVAIQQRSSRDLENLAPLLLPVEQRPGWFRQHPMVRATFAAQLRLQSAERVIALHAAAASWFGERGHLEKAVHHAVKSGNFTLAAEAIRRAGGVNLFIRAGHTVLERLIENIPTADVYRSPSLKLSYSLVLAKKGRIQAAREIIDDLKSSGEIPSAGDDTSNPELDFGHIESMIDIYEDTNFEDGVADRFEAMLVGFTPKDTWDKGWIYNHLVVVYTRNGNLEMARSSALKALACYREERTAYAQIFMLIHAALVANLMGRPSTGILLSREAEALVQSTQWSDRNLMAIVHIPLAEALYQQADVKTAERLMREGMPYLARGEGWVDLYVRGYGTLARAQMTLSGIEPALAVLDRADEVAIERELPRLRVAVDIVRLELLTRAGLLESAQHLAATLPPLDNPSAWPTWREWNDGAIAMARLLARTGKPDTAVWWIEALIDDATGRQHACHVLGGSVVAIEAYWAAGRMEDALAALQRSIALARPQDWLQVFLDEGQPLSQAVRGIVRRFGLSTFSPKTAEFVSRIAGAFHQGNTTQLQPRTELLSTRESEILEYLARDATNKEIARDLGLTESTVKFHLKNLYAKLGVGRRSLAVSVARKVSLLSLE